MRLGFSSLYLIALALYGLAWLTMQPGALSWRQFEPNLARTGSSERGDGARIGQSSAQPHINAFPHTRFLTRILVPLDVVGLASVHADEIRPAVAIHVRDHAAGR